MSKNLFEKIAAVVMIFNDQHADTDYLIELVLSRHRWPSGLLLRWRLGAPQMY
jgi:hypothetical protein